MDPTWLELAKQAPFLFAFIWLVIVFLKHIKETGSEMREVVSKCAEAFDRNSEALGRASLALDQHERRNGGR